MKGIVSKIKGMPGFRMISGVSEEKIDEAEKELGVRFAGEYRDYLSEFGVATFEGHEFTGICNSKRLNVVDVTKEERNLNPDIPEELYVVERSNIDNAIIWQSPSGEIYQSIPNQKTMIISESLQDYIGK